MINELVKPKVILVDWSVFINKSVHVYHKFTSHIGSPERLALFSLFKCLRTIGINKDLDQVILACDAQNNWRKKVDGEYKANRVKIRAESDIDWDLMYRKFDKLLFNIEESTPFHIVKIDTLEADDIIAYSVKQYPDKEVIAVSTDCLAGNTKVRLAKGGSKAIRDIKIGEEVLSYDIDNKIFSKSKVTNWVQKNHKIRYKIYHDGCKLPINSSENHLFLTKKGWKKSKELKIGDVLYHAKERIYPVDNYQNHYKLGYLLGLITGDSSVRYNEKAFFIEMCDIEALLRAQEYLKDLFNIDVKILKQKLKTKRKQTYKINCYLNYRFDYLFNKINLKSKSFYKGYCAGFYDAEGSLSEQKTLTQISFYQNGHKELRKIKKFLNILNIKSSFIFKSCGKCNKITLNSEESIKFLNLCKPSILRKYPTWKYHKLHLQNGYKILKIELAKTTLKNFKDYDITVEPYHNYIIEGNVIVHNSDFDQLFYYDNFRFFSIQTKTYKLPIKNAQKVLANKIKCERTDNLVRPIDSVEAYERRKKIVNLIDLPDDIEKLIKKTLDILPEKEYNVSKLFGGKPDLIKAYESIYTKDEYQKLLNKKIHKEKESFIGTTLF